MSLGQKVMSLIIVEFISYSFITANAIRQIDIVGAEVKQMSELYLPLFVTTQDIHKQIQEERLSFSETLNVGERVVYDKDAEATFVASREKYMLAQLEIEKLIDKQINLIQNTLDKTDRSDSLIFKYSPLLFEVLRDIISGASAHDQTVHTVFKHVEDGSFLMGLELLGDVKKADDHLISKIDELLNQLNLLKNLSVAYSQKVQEDAEGFTILVAVVTIIIGITVIFLVVKLNITKPLHLLTSTIESFDALKNPEKSPDEEELISRGDELGMVSRSFNKLKGELVQATRELYKEKEGLERKVEERTHKLQASEDQFRTLVQNIPGVSYRCLLDKEWTMLYMSDAIKELSGYSPGDFINNAVRTFGSIIHPEDREKVARSVEECSHKNITFTIEYRILRSDGETRWVREKGQPSLDERGDVSFLDGAIFDITEQHNVEQELRQINQQSDTALDLTKAGYWHIPLVDDPDYYLSSEKAASIFGDPPRPDHRYHLMDEWFANVMAGDKEAAEATLEKFKGALEGRYPLYDATYAYKRPVDGQVVWIHALAYISRDEDGKATDMYGVTQDITESKLLESELRIARAKAEEATQSKSDFLANMSHEIRTPMNAIIGMSHLALKTELTPKQINYLLKIDSSSKSLLGIINDILDFSKIEAGKLDMEEVDFDLSEVLDNLSNLVTLKAQEKGLEVLFSVDRDVPYLLVGDSLRLGQILINLANNAVKFTEHGEVIISIKVMEEEASDRVRLQFSVKDTGIGLTPDQAGKLFQAFSQADPSTTRKFGGTGLGLTICKHLVGMMNGKIWVESIPGKGSTFIFTANLGSGSDKKKSQLVLSDDLQKMRVLIVDDNEAARLVLENALTSFDLRVSMASSGSEGISKVESADLDDPYDFIVMDWQMPEMNGIRTSEIIKKHPNLKKIPKIIMLTAYGREEVIHQAEEIGMDAFLVKPMNPSVLLETVMEIFGKKTTSRQKSVRADQGEDLGTILGANVLLVEDNEINQEVANELLSQAGFVVTIANHGQEGVEKVNGSDFDCVLMDCQMPVMDGYEATRTIRNDKRFNSLPILAMTANAMKGDREKCIEAGMDDHIAKPINPKELFSAMIKWISPREGIGRKAQSSPEIDQFASKESVLPELSGIDVDAGLMRVNGNEKLYRKLLSSFYQSNKNTKNEIEKAVEEGDFRLAERLVHTVKGVSATIGADKLAEVSQPLEAELHNENKDIDEMLWNDFWDNLAGVLSAIKQAEPDENEGSDEELDLTKIKLPQTLIDAMKKDVNGGLLMELDQYFSEIARVEPDGKRLADHLKELADQFDDAGILKILGEIENN